MAKKPKDSLEENTSNHWKATHCIEAITENTGPWTGNGFLGDSSFRYRFYENEVLLVTRVTALKIHDKSWACGLIIFGWQSVYFIPQFPDFLFFLVQFLVMLIAIVKNYLQRFYLFN